MVIIVKPFESIIEKEEECHMMPRKPKPLCSCFIGDMMVDMYPRLNFDTKYTNCSRVFIGHTHENLDSFFNNISIYDGDNEEVNDSIEVINEYLRYHKLLLH